MPLDRIASYFAGLAPQLVIEFVPKDDPMVRTLLATREDVFDDYTMDGFRTAFDGAWEVVDEAPVSGTPRTLVQDGQAAMTEAALEGDSAGGRTRGRWWLIPWYPAAFPIAFILFMWSGTGIEPIWVVRPMLIAVAFTLLLTFLLALLLGDRDRGALAATAFVVALALGNVLASAAVALIGLLVVVEGLVNRGIAWRLGRTATRALSALGAALILVVVLASVQQGSFGWAVEDVQARLARQPMAAAYDPAAPDIYVILLDGYPGDDAAELDPSFDADAFPDALEERGFDVQRHSRSNYLLTRLTLATMFGNDHVAEATQLRPPFGPEQRDNRRLRLFADEGPVLRALDDAGFETITITSASLDLALYNTDRVVTQPGAQEFETALLKITTDRSRN